MTTPDPVAVAVEAALTPPLTEAAAEVSAWAQAMAANTVNGWDFTAIGPGPDHPRLRLRAVRALAEHAYATGPACDGQSCEQGGAAHCHRCAEAETDGLLAERDQLRRDLEKAKTDRDSWQHIAASRETTAAELQFITELLGILAEAEKTFQDTPMLWHVKDGHPAFAMACSDTFAWGCADAEPITPEDLPLLRQTLTDLKAADQYGEIWLGELYCCRKRGMRPMNRWIKDMREREGLPDGVLALIEAAGPPRESVFGAP